MTENYKHRNWNMGWACDFYNGQKFKKRNFILPEWHPNNNKNICKLHSEERQLAPHVDMTFQNAAVAEDFTQWWERTFKGGMKETYSINSQLTLS